MHFVKDSRSCAVKQSVVFFQFFCAVLEVAKEKIQYPPSAIQYPRMGSEVDIHHSRLFWDEVTSVASSNKVADTSNLIKSEICALDNALHQVACKK